MMESHHKKPHNAVVDLTEKWLSESYTEQRTGIDYREKKTSTISNTKAVCIFCTVTNYIFYIIT